jgi:hypothetical protein
MEPKAKPVVTYQNAVFITAWDELECEKCEVAYVPGPGYHPVLGNRRPWILTSKIVKKYANQYGVYRFETLNTVYEKVKK